jgi:hypothetical protein
MKKNKEVKCVTCGDFLAEEELPENKLPQRSFPGFPLPMENECKICWVKRADADSPLNLNYPTHMKEHEETIRGLEEAKKKRRSVN